MTNSKKDRFLRAMLTEKNIEQAYKKAEISKTTAYKYLKDDNFKAELLKAKREIMSQVTTQLQQKALSAVQVVAEIMTSKESPDFARLQAAKTILDNAYKGLELEDLQADIEMIKEAMKDNEGNKNGW